MLALSNLSRYTRTNPGLVGYTGLTGYDPLCAHLSPLGCNPFRMHHLQVCMHIYTYFARMELSSARDLIACPALILLIFCLTFCLHLHVLASCHFLLSPSALHFISFTLVHFIVSELLCLRTVKAHFGRVSPSFFSIFQHSCSTLFS